MDDPDLSGHARDERTRAARLEAALAGFARVRELRRELGQPDVDVVALIRECRQELEERGADQPGDLYRIGPRRGRSGTVRRPTA